MLANTLLLKFLHDIFCEFDKENSLVSIYLYDLHTTEQPG